MVKNLIQTHQLVEHGVDTTTALNLTQKINQCLQMHSKENAWQSISKKILTPDLPFSLHLFLFKHLFPRWPEEPDSAPAWIPETEFIKTTNIAAAMSKLNFHTYQEFQAWSVQHYEKFWEFVIQTLGIVFHIQYERICEQPVTIANPQWLPGAELNIAESCFIAPPTQTAILFQQEGKELQRISYDELDRLSNRVANSLIKQHFRPGDAIAIYMPMTYLAVAIYLGIIKMGGVVVSIAESFSSDEVATRLNITHAKGVFTQDIFIRQTKIFPLYEKIKTANAPCTIVLPHEENTKLQLRTGDLSWETFLITHENFHAQPSAPMSHFNILFSSGTTAEPKAIPWNHTTAIKAASDAYFHHNIQKQDVLAWPTSLGWMMGPWLIFAALINQATIALYEGLPQSRGFGQFIQDSQTTLLGVVPTLVANWRQTHCMEGLNWQAIKLFSSTGECSNPEDMLYLMSLAGYKPIIEYCGGTEIGGGYVTSTVIQKNYPSTFSTPALGIDFLLLNEKNLPANKGEVAIIPPSLGLSTELLNFDHYHIYFENMPTAPDGAILRRHGDQLIRFKNHYYSVLGRTDDTMNLSGIKISSAEIERVLVGIENIIETAAIALQSERGGPSHLLIYAATKHYLNSDTDKKKVKEEMQKRISQHLNPLFKIEDVIFVSDLPKTASNKIMRRMLRNNVKQRHPHGQSN